MPSVCRYVVLNLFALQVSRDFDSDYLQQIDYLFTNSFHNACTPFAMSIKFQIPLKIDAISRTGPYYHLNSSLCGECGAVFLVVESSSHGSAGPN